MGADIPHDLVTYDEAAREFGVTVPQIRYLILKGHVTKYKRGAASGYRAQRSPQQRPSQQ